MSTPTLYKITGPNGECLNGGSGDWPMPTATEPGEWRRVDGDIVPCRNGLHITDAAHLDSWLPIDGYTIHRVEIDGEIIDAGGKYVAAAVRLLPRRKPMPDIAAERERLGRVRARAARHRDPVVQAAHEAYAAAVPARGYLSRIDPTTLPAGHPLSPAAAAMRAAESARDAVLTDAAATYAAATAPAEARYRRMLARAVDGA